MTATLIGFDFLKKIVFMLFFHSERRVYKSEFHIFKLAVKKHGAYFLCVFHIIPSLMELCSLCNKRNVQYRQWANKTEKIEQG